MPYAIAAIAAAAYRRRLRRSRYACHAAAASCHAAAILPLFSFSIIDAAAADAPPLRHDCFAKMPADATLSLDAADAAVAADSFDMPLLCHAFFATLFAFAIR